MSRPDIAEFICSIRKASQPAISPDGSCVAYVVSATDRTSFESTSTLWLVDIDGTNSREFSSAGDQVSSPIWTVDGTGIIFVSPLADTTGFGVIEVLVETGESRILGRHDVPPGNLALSPDGKTLAFAAYVDPQAASAPSPRLPPVRVVTRLDYKEDGLGIPNGAQFQIFLLDLGTSDIRKITDVPRDHATLIWSPDGTKLGAIRKSRVGLQRQLVVIDIASGSETLLGQDDRPVTAWVWTGDGTGIIAFHSDHPEIGGDFFHFNLETGTERQLTNGMRWSIDHARTPIAWIDDTHLLVSGYEQARSGLWQLDITTGCLERIRLDDEYNTGIMASVNPVTIVQQHRSATDTDELIAIDLETQQSTALTSLNTDLFAKRPPASIEELTTRHEGLDISWLLKRPHDFDPAKTYPVVFEIHGGPHMFRGFEIEVSNQLLIESGYLVVCPNPRGSLSFGRDYAASVMGDWGGGDWRDFLAVVDAVSALPFVDDQRLGIYGYSYGGYMASWAIGQTDRFRAVVIGAPLTDLLSRDGTADIGYAAPEFEYHGEMPGISDRLVAQSPVTHMHKAVTPSLILHPEDDQRCPIGQSEELFVGLKRAGVEVEFVRYPGSSHLMPWYGPAEYRIDYYTRLIDWFDRYV